MSRGRGASLARMRRRGRVDVFGKPLMKRPYNNSKRTKGRQGQADIQMHYSEIMKRARHIKGVAIRMKNDGVTLGEGNWKTKWREYSNSNMLLDDTEKEILFRLVEDK